MIMETSLKLFLIIVSLLFSFHSCKPKGCTDINASNYDSKAKKDDGSCLIDETTGSSVLPPISDSSTILGFNLLEKLPGIWNGPVSSPTPLGGYPEWIVDFRPISASQVSAKNELDSINDIFMSFFIVKHNNEYKIAFRNGGGFAGNVRNAYQVLESFNETPSASYYKFVDPAAGESRVYTDITFKQDSLIMHVFTNQFNTLSTAVTHMKWNAKLKDLTSTQSAINLFNYPKKEMTKDFTTIFDGQTDAVYYSTSSDPYPESEQPYLGNSTINITITNPSNINANNKVLVIITTQPLFNNFTFLTANLKYRSRYVFVDAKDNTSFNFNYMHPGTYYVNTIYDNNGDYGFSSGDYMNSILDVPFTLTDEGTTTTNVTIDFQIP
jgi:hypothetical protein